MSVELVDWIVEREHFVDISRGWLRLSACIPAGEENNGRIRSMVFSGSTFGL